MKFNKVIVSDVDGVILNFNKSFINFVNNKTKKSYYENQCIFYDFKISLGLSDNKYKKIYNEFIDNGSIHKLKYYNGVINLFNYFKNKGFIINLVTKIENRIKEKRSKNLSNINYNSINYCGDKRIKLIKDIKPIYVFEDRPKYIFEYLKIKKYFKFLFIPIRPYNYKYITKWIRHEQIFVYDCYKKLLKKFKLLEEINEI